MQNNLFVSRDIGGNKRKFVFNAGMCKGQSSDVTYLEHVEVEFPMSYITIAATSVFITSASGAVSISDNLKPFLSRL